MTGPSALPAAADRSFADRLASPSTACRIPATQGDTLASALLANGVHLDRALVQVSPAARHAAARAPRSRTRLSPSTAAAAASTPNLRATQVELYDGLVAESQNRWPSLALRRRRGQRPASAGCFGAGFYYKTFMWPPVGLEDALRADDPRARRALASRRASPIPIATRTATPIATCWSSAPARPASRPRSPRRESGARVILCDEQAELGGWLLAEPDVDDRREDRARMGRGHGRRARRNAERARCCRARTAFGYYAQNFVGLAERLTDHLPHRRSRPAARAAVAGAGQAGGARDRRHRASAGLPGQRPARASCSPIAARTLSQPTMA